VDTVLGDQFRRLLKPFTPATEEAPSADGFSLDVENLEDAKPSEGDEKAPDVKSESDTGDEQAATPN
jgi:hypothetical protein